MTTWTVPLVRLGRAASIAALCLALAGCSRALAPPVRYYVLNPLEPSAEAVADAATPLSVSLAVLRLPRHLERPQIVTRSTGNRLEVAERSRWGGSLKDNVMQVLARNLSILVPTTDITVAPRLTPAAADFVLEVEVLRFERGEGGRVRLSAMWRLFGGAERKLLVSRVSEMASPPVPLAGTLEPTVAAMGDLLGQLSRRIAESIRQQASAGRDGE